MHRFSTDREALDFISSRLADEAQREGVALSEVERKMLYFSETAWTLPEIWDVSDEFDRNYDRGAYEKKISRLITKAIGRARKEPSGELEAWTEVIRLLSKEDRYLLVMVGQARLGPKFRRSSTPRVLRRIQAALIAGVALFVGLAWFINKRFPETNLPPGSRGGGGFAIWLAMVCLAALYGLALLLARVLRFSNKASRALDWIFGIPKRGE